MEISNISETSLEAALETLHSLLQLVEAASIEYFVSAQAGVDYYTFKVTY